MLMSCAVDAEMATGGAAKGLPPSSEDPELDAMAERRSSREEAEAVEDLMANGTMNESRGQHTLY